LSKRVVNFGVKKSNPVNRHNSAYVSQSVSSSVSVYKSLPLPFYVLSLVFYLCAPHGKKY